MYHLHTLIHMSYARSIPRFALREKVTLRLLKLLFKGVDVVEWSGALDVRLSEWCCSVSMVWVQIPSREEQNLTAQKSNSNTGWFNFQTYIYIHVNTHTSLLLKCYVPLFMRKGWIATIDWLHGVGSNQFLSVNIGVIRLLSVITTTPFGNYGTSETMFDQKSWKKTKNIGNILPILSFTEQ